MSVVVLFVIRGNVLLSINSKELNKNIKYMCYKSKTVTLQHPRQVADLIYLPKCVHSHLDSYYLVGNVQYH